jgi:hypothetical protein
MKRAEAATTSKRRGQSWGKVKRVTAAAVIAAIMAIPGTSFAWPKPTTTSTTASTINVADFTNLSARGTTWS